MGVFKNYDDCLSVLGKKFDPATAQKVCGKMQKDKGGSMNYNSSVADVLERDGLHFVKVFAINDAVYNKNGWGVTKDAMNAALQSLLGKPLLGNLKRGHGPDTTT